MNKKTIGVLGVAAVALVGGTFAYFTQTTTVDNPFDTAKYSTVVTEDFVPEDGEKWEPGVEVNKDLYVQNTGDRDVVVRVKFEDFWYREKTLGEGLITKGQDSNNFNTFVELAGEVVTAQLSAEQKTFQIDSTDGDTKKKEDGKEKFDGTVVLKTFDNSDKWVLNKTDGYYYYRTTLPGGQSTEKFLDKVKLDPELDLGLFNTWIYAKLANKGMSADELEVDVPEGKTEEEIKTFMKQKGWIQIGTEPMKGKVANITATKLTEYNKYAGTEYDKNYLLNNNYGIYTTAITRPESGKLGYSDANYTLRITVETVQATDEAVMSTFFAGDKGQEALNEEGFKDLAFWKSLSKEDLATNSNGS